MIVDELKKSILEYAISGKLSLQNLDEKVNLAEDDCLNSKELFEIPQNWRWTKISKIGTLIRGNGIKRSETTSFGVPCVRYGEIYTHYSYNFSDTISFVPQKIAEKCKIASKGDILLTLTGENEYDIAKATAYIGNDSIVIGGDMCILTDHHQNPMYLVFYLFSPFAIKQKSSSAKGNIIVHTSTSNIGNFYIPLPPLEEQQRIVNKIEKLFAKLDEIKPIEQELIEIKSKFGSDMRDSILLYAMQGKLTEQNKDETIKISINNKFKIVAPYTIPDNWKSLSHNDLFEIVGGSQPPKSKFSDKKLEGFIRLYQTRDYGPNPQPVYVDKNDVSKFSNKDDIILARYGGSLGKVFWAEDGAYNVALAKVVIKYPECINKKFLYYYYLSDLYQSKVKNGNRSAQAGFSKEDLNDLFFPLPPIEEQQRIVDKIEELLPLCDDIEKLVSK